MSQHEDRPDCSGCFVTDPSQMRASEPVEDGIGRRTFLVQSGILAAMAALAACGASGDATAPSVPANSQINIGSYPSLASVGGVALVSVGNAPIAIVRTGTSTFLALSRVCPHQGGSVSQSSNRWVCPIHGATFDIDGNWIGGQRTSSLHQYTTTFVVSAFSLSFGCSSSLV